MIKSTVKVKGKRINIIGPPYLTKFERARIIGARALQLSLGAPPLIDIKGLKDPIKIAEKELELGVLPMVIRRKLPDGTYQDIPIKYLLSEGKHK